jgi:hypothetical protein
MMIHEAALKPIARPVKDMIEGLIDKPKKKPKYSYFFNMYNKPYPVRLMDIRAFETVVVNLMAFIRS